MITMIWAEDENGLIGKKGQMPWQLPADLNHFKTLTDGDTVLMGRKTYDSLPKKPLSNRRNIILTRDDHFQAKEVMICHSVEEVFRQVDCKTGVLHVIGGSDVYNQFKDKADMLYRTVIHEQFEGDTYFPKLDYSKFKLISQEQRQPDDNNKYAYTFYSYKRV